jgi:hypothetical protein
MASVTTQSEPTRYVLGLIKSLEVSVEDLLQVTRERIKETQSRDAKVLTEFLENRAASKDGLLAKAAGEAFSVETVCSLLQIGKAAVHKAKDEGRLLAYQVPGKRHYLFPAFQFEGAAVARWIPELIEIVGNGFAALHFLTVERKSLRNESFLIRLNRNERQEARDDAISSILKTARSLAP